MPMTFPGTNLSRRDGLIIGRLVWKERSAPPFFRAFTLLELIVAVSILGLASAMLLANFRIGIRSYKSARDVVEANETVIGGLALLEKDCSDMIPIDDNKVVFERNAMAFVMIDEFETPPQLVTYRFEEGALLRNTETFSKTTRDDELSGEKPSKNGKREDSVPIMTGVQELRLEYYQKGEWRETVPPKKTEKEKMLEETDREVETERSEKSLVASELKTEDGEEKKEGRLPRAVRVTGVHLSDSGRPEPFSLALPLAWSKPERLKSNRQKRTK